MRHNHSLVDDLEMINQSETDQKPDINDEVQSGNVVQGHLVTLKSSRDGNERVFFLDPSGQLHPVLGAEFTSATAIIKVNTV